MTEARHLVIQGQVQGVGFRYSIQLEALKVGISGWVCNKLDGSVEAVVAGNEMALAKILRWVQLGPHPFGAKVTQICVEETTSNSHGFLILPTT